MVDRYINVGQQYINGKVASALCPGGAVKYVLKEGSGICREWLLAYIVPGIMASFNDEDNLLVLALPVLWLFSDPIYWVKVPA